MTWERWTEENKTYWIQSGFLVQIVHPGDKVLLPRVTDSSPEQLTFIIKRKQLWKTLPLIVLKIKRSNVFKAIRMMLGDSHSQVNSISQWTLSTDNKTAPWFGDEGVATGFRESSFMVFVGCRMRGRECYVSVSSSAICRGNGGERGFVLGGHPTDENWRKGKYFKNSANCSSPFSLPPVVTVGPANVADCCSSKKWYLMAEVRIPYITLRHLFHDYIVPSQVQMQQAASSGDSTFGVY